MIGMKYFILLSIMIGSSSQHIIFDFSKDANINKWIIVDDVVMGGKSSGTFKLSDEGHGVFQGDVSLANNGGFSSVRHRFDKLQVNNATKVYIRLKGDGKKYQFRVKSNVGDYYSYITSFVTNGSWQEVELELKDMYPSFRGRKLNLPNFSEDYIEEVALLIGNKKKESFKVEIDKIELH